MASKKFQYKYRQIRRERGHLSPLSFQEVVDALLGEKSIKLHLIDMAEIAKEISL
jgi:hypothetical protein